MKETPDIIMFPGWKRDLERSSIDAIEQKNYEEALLYIHKLEQFESASNDILVAKIIALSELGRNDQAISLCRRLMKEDRENYYQHLHIYLNILFQSNQYSEVLETVEQVQNDDNVPIFYKEQFQVLYEQSQQFRDTIGGGESERDMAHFMESLENGNFHEQWKLLSYHRNFPVEPYLPTLKPYFVDPKLNPVIKTGLLQWCMDEEISEPIEIEKFDQKKWVTPSEQSDVLETKFSQEVNAYLTDIEQNDPTLYAFILQILYRYMYILFPFTPKMNVAEEVALAVQSLAVRYLSIDLPYNQQNSNTENITTIMDEIERYERLYYTQVDN